MKIIYQYLDLVGTSYWTSIVSTVMLLVSFAGIILYSMSLSKKHIDDMGRLPLDN